MTFINDFIERRAAFEQMVKEDFKIYNDKEMTIARTGKQCKNYKAPIKGRYYTECKDCGFLHIEVKPIKK